jgi:ornithine carbamoyltransferase
MRHFLTENDFDQNEIIEVFEQASLFKKNRAERPSSDLTGQSWGLLFYKNSTRTRVSFEVGIRELGANPLVIDQSSTQIGRGESIGDTARVLSRYLDGLVIRTHGHEVIDEFAKHSSIPVVNALTDFLHPCQIYADCMTILEKKGGETNPFAGLQGKKLAFFGDTSCNMANSWILAGALFGMDVHLAGPAQFQPGPQIQEFCKKNGLPENWHFTADPLEAASGADVIYTDVWVSMGCEEQEQERFESMAPYRVNSEILAKAKDDCLFMHCMPAHPEEEVTQKVLDSPHAVLLDQAENRLHMQKAILRSLFSLRNKTKAS